VTAGVLGSVLGWERSLFALLRRELAPSPVRIRAWGRILVGTLAAVTLTMVLQIPQGEFLLVTFFVVNQTDAWASLTKALLRVVGTIVGGLVGLGGIVLFADQAAFLYALQGVVVGLSLFFSRTTTAPYAFLLAGVTFLMITPDYISTPSFGVDTALWRMGLTTLGALMATGAQLLLWPDHPQELLLEDLQMRLQRAARALDRQARGSGAPVFARDPVAAVGMAGQLDLLASAEAMSRWLRQRHAEQVALIVAVQRIVSAAVRLERIDADPAALHPDTIGCVEQLRGECLRLARAIAERRAPPAARTPPAGASALAPSSKVEVDVLASLAEIEEGLLCAGGRMAFLDLPIESRVPTREPLAPLTLFNPDCSPRNTDAVRFALKGALGASICALIYAALHWPQISTCVLTCLVVAQSTVGAGRRRSQLRILGAVLGGLGALLAILVLMPNMTSLASLLVVVAVLFGAAAWVVTGTSRISYAGMQMAITLSLLLINGLGPTTDLDPWRDRLFGVLLGITVMGTIDAVVWPVFARDTIREKLAQALEAMAQLQRHSAAARELALRHAAIVTYRRLAEGLALEDEVLAEPEWHEEHAAQRALALRLTSAAQDVFLAQLAVWRHRRAIAAAGPSQAVRGALADLDEDLAQRLESLAHGLRRGRVERDVPPPGDDALRALAAVSASEDLREAVVVYRDLLTLFPRLRAGTAALNLSAT